jgi:hypothetical protein
MLRSLALAALAALGAACLAPPSAAQRLSDAAIDMNTATRFGRMDIAMDYVSAQGKDAFTAAHSQWGKRIRIVDVEFSGVTVKERDEADVNVTIVWQFVDDPVMRESKLVQHWKDTRGTWSILREHTEEPDGLLGRQAPPQRLSVLPPATPPPGAALAAPPQLPVEIATPDSAAAAAKAKAAARFQTHVISSDD